MCGFMYNKHKTKGLWSSGPKWAARFRCDYCNKLRSGNYRWVDGLRSCKNCNEEYGDKK